MALVVSTPTSETRTSTRTVRQIARCKKCKTVRSRLIVRETTSITRWTAIGPKTQRFSRELLDGVALADWRAQAAGDCNCARPRGMYFTDVCGVHNQSPCDDRCTGAVGNKCECSCGGKNHGADHG